MKPTTLKTAVLTLMAVSLSALAQSESHFTQSLALAPADSGSTSGGAADDDKAAAAELAKKLQNPVANLISVPLQNNFDFGGGPNDDGFRYTLNVQPVIPFTLNEDLNLITRTIIPFIHQEDLVGTSSQTGLGDITQTFFLSPAKPGNLIWGAGPVMLYPSATDDLLGTEKFGIGPSVVALRQTKGWTFWTLANHIWSVAGDGGRDDVSSTYINPGISYQTKTLTTFLVQAEPVYDWEHSQWTVPVEAGIAQLVKFGKQPVSFSLQGRYFAEKPAGGPDWGLRFVVTFVFPK
jgi:hypothetical protein